MEDGMKISELTEATLLTGEDVIAVVNGNETKQATIEQVASYTNDLIAPRYCRATLTTEPTASGNSYVPLDTIYSSGAGFEIQSGGIKIPAGINNVLVSGSVFLNNFPGGNAYLWAKIYRQRGNESANICGSLNNSASSYISASIPGVIVEVQEGDIIKLMADSPSGGKVRPYSTNTWLSVEKVD